MKRSGRKGTVSKARQLGSDFQPQETSVLPKTPRLKRCLSARALWILILPLILHRGGFVLPLKAPPPPPQHPEREAAKTRIFLLTNLEAVVLGL